MTVEAEPRFDRATFSLLWARLISVADEMATTIWRLAFSSIVRENLDYSAGIFDERGQMVAQPTHASAGHVGAMIEFVKNAIPDLSDVCEGDVYITNHPWIGCGHTPDLYLIAPIYRGGTRVGFAVTSSHQVDMGGRHESTESREVFEEGLIIPPLKLVSAGVTNEPILAIINQNVRMPDKVIGDIRAQMAALDVGSRRTLELLYQYELDTLVDITNQIENHTDSVVQAAIRDHLAPGAYPATIDLEETDSSGDPIRLEVRIVVGDGLITVDYTGTSKEVPQPINCVYNYTRAYTIVALKMILCPTLPNNAGSYRHVETIAPKGSVLNPRFPAAVMFRHVVGVMIPDLIFNALEDVCPKDIIAGSGAAPVWLYSVQGRRTDGSPFLLHSHGMGGLGARHSKDGLDAISFPSNVFALPTEILEQENPLVCARRAFRRDSGGAGRYRGGLGESVVLHIRTGADVDPMFPVVAAVSSGWTTAGAPGRDGGLPGAPGFIAKNSKRLKPGDSHDLQLVPGDELELATPGGGGFGDPLMRDKKRIEADISSGRVSDEAASVLYGLR